MAMHSNYIFQAGMGIQSNFRVTVKSEKGGRNYMEDEYAVHFEEKDTEGETGDMEFGFFGIFDGHGGPEAAQFTRENLLKEIKSREGFWSKDDEDVLQAIREGFIATHHAMWNELPKWPKRSMVHPSTAGTTASVAILKNNKLYIGHVGDSGIVLGQDTGSHLGPVCIVPKTLTKDHKPDDPEEKERIEKMGGQVACKSGVQRVVWNRPKAPHSGPIRRSTQMDQIPFLAVARSLGDLWSHNPMTDKYAVSPEPDLSVIELNEQHRFLILGSDGLWNMLSARDAVNKVATIERYQALAAFEQDYAEEYWGSPSNILVKQALNRWTARGMRADNITCLTIMLDPPGGSFTDIIERRRDINFVGPPWFPTEIPEEEQDLTWELIVRYAGKHSILQKKYSGLNTPPQEKETNVCSEEDKKVVPKSSGKTTEPEKNSDVATKSGLTTTPGSNGLSESRKRKWAAKRIKHLDAVARRVTLDLVGHSKRDNVGLNINRNMKEYRRKSASATVTSTYRDIKHAKYAKHHRSWSAPLSASYMPYTGPGKVMIARPRDINATPRSPTYVPSKPPLNCTTAVEDSSSKKISSPPAGVVTPPKTPEITEQKVYKLIFLGEEVNGKMMSLDHPERCYQCDGWDTTPHMHERYYGPVGPPKNREDVVKLAEKVLAETRLFREQIVAKRNKEMAEAKKKKRIENRHALALKKQVNGIESFTSLKRKRQACQSPDNSKVRKLDSKTEKEKFNKSVTNAQTRRGRKACKV